METERLERQMDFLLEVEKLKLIYRQNQLVDGSRAESTAEHSWHIALMAMLLDEHAVDPEVDLLTVVKMLLVHDIVEIDAGDTFLYDARGNLDKEAREQRAADRIFGLLPEDQRDECLRLWREFDARESASALYAAAIDNLQPILNHWKSAGVGIKPHKISKREVIERKCFIRKVSPWLWDYARKIIEKSAAAGFYREDDES